MSVVTKATYESLQQKIADSFSAVKGASPQIASGLQEIVDLDDADQEFDLLFSFYNLNNSTTSVFEDTTNFIAVTAALQNHVELRSGSTITQFLTDQGILVDADFKDDETL